MKKAVRRTTAPDMLDEYDFSKGVRGKYARAVCRGLEHCRFGPGRSRVFSGFGIGKQCPPSTCRCGPQNIRKGAG